jgi:hypothetical protein
MDRSQGSSCGDSKNTTRLALQVLVQGIKIIRAQLNIECPLAAPASCWPILTNLHANLIIANLVESVGTESVRTQRIGSGETGHA